MMRAKCSKLIGVAAVSIVLGTVLFLNGWRTPDLNAGEAPNQAESPLIVYRLNPMSNERALPDSYPEVPGTAGGELSLAGCRGEYESASLAVYAKQDVLDLRLEIGDLRRGKHILPASSIDPYVVKCWYQAGRDVLFFTPDKKLVPELLLKDDALVRVDIGEESNAVRSTAEDGKTAYLPASGTNSAALEGVRPIDAATLQPVTIPGNTLKQFWLTVHIPQDAAAGRYTGLVRLSAAGITSVDVPLEVTVHPFDLARPRIIYSLYHPSKLEPNTPDGTIAAHYKSEEQYRVELRDLKAHGVLYPNLWQALDSGLVPRVLELRKEAGLPNDTLFTLTPTGSPSGAPGLVKAWQELAAPFGYKEVYLYGEDEASGDALRRQRSSWDAVQKAGGKTYASAWKEDPFELMGSRLNMLVWSGGANPEKAKQWHSVGSQIFSYSNPQVGVEEPATYRYNYGLALWKAGYDGTMTFAYQWAYGHIWNDFDSVNFREACFTYPTVNGIVGTIQWEGFREGVDDVRYITTLEKAIAQAGDTEPARQARAWLDDLRGRNAHQKVSWIEQGLPQENPDEVRARAVGWIRQVMD